jgi:hypothetical protein
MLLFYASVIIQVNLSSTKHYVIVVCVAILDLLSFEMMFVVKMIRGLLLCVVCPYLN